MRSARAAFTAMSLLLLAACGGGGSGGDTTANPAPAPGSGGGGFVYSGPAPQNADVQRFQVYFYNNLVNDNRCGTCHTRGGQGTGAFVDRGDVNVAYAAALPLVNLSNPPMSPIVDKVNNGHNCWEASTAACRVQMISFIEGWANAGAGGSTSVKLNAPADRDPNGPDSDNDGDSDGFRSFPDEATFGASQLYSLVKTHCARCHSDTSGVQQQPYFASDNVSLAYTSIQSKIDLNDPSLFNALLRPKSRLVVRLREEFHNCWTTNCASDAGQIQTAIAALAGAVAPTQLNPSTYRSMGQVLNDGIVGSSGGRFEQYQIALWRFLEGEGKVASDTSGIAPAISLELEGLEGEGGDFMWVGGGGVQFNTGVAHGTAAASRKLFDAIAPVGEYSVEAWLVPGNVADEDRQIIAYSDGTPNRNFMLGQTMYNYDYLNRSNQTNNRGEPNLSTDPDDMRLQAGLQHVVVTYDPVNGRRIYVDGEFTNVTEPTDRGTLANDWSDDYVVIFGNNLSQTLPWKGAVRMAAVHKRALTADQIDQNFAVKPGEKRYLMFNVSHIAGMPASCAGTNAGGDPVSYCYVYFQVSQYDNYGYLFSNPYFISLNPALLAQTPDLSALPVGLTIKGIRIGVNGLLAPVGQAYVNVNATISQANYTVGNEPGQGQRLATIGTVLPKVSGADADLFYLEFDQIGMGNPDQTPAPVVTAFGYTLEGLPEFGMGWRTFDEIDAAFSQLTGVTHSTVIVQGPPAFDVGDVVGVVRRQLPTVESFSGFLASHQTAVSQLAVAYCAALVNDTDKRDDFFTAGSTPAFFRANWRTNVVDPLVNGFIGNSGVASLPGAAAIGDELEDLITHPGDINRKAGVCAAGCASDADTLRAVKIACAAALSNAAVTLQ